MAPYPSQWQYAVSPVAGVAADITIPAIVGIAHVLTSISAQLFVTASATADPAILVLFGGVQIVDGLLLADANAVPSTVALASWNWAGALPAPTNTTVEVKFNSTAATQSQFLIIQGYEI